MPSRAVAWGLALALAIALFVGGMAAGGGFRRTPVPPPRLDDGGPVDVGFLQHMAVHHDQAIEMARIAGERGTSRMRQLGEQIAATQLVETGEMRGWLEMWSRPVIPTSTSMDWILRHPNARWTVGDAYFRMCGETGAMPGMATVDEMDGLRQAQGAAFTIAFLQLMLRHHLSALPMARFAMSNAATPVVRSLAARIIREQSEEISAMRIMLRQAGGKPLPFYDIDAEIVPPADGTG